VAADGLQDAADVVDLVLEHVAGGAAVGQAVAEAVVQGQPRERRELAEELGEGGVLPDQPEVGRPAEQEDEVQVPSPTTW
jgi:hypothetical protein